MTQEEMKHKYSSCSQLIAVVRAMGYELGFLVHG